MDKIYMYVILRDLVAMLIYLKCQQRFDHQSKTIGGHLDVSA